MTQATLAILTLADATQTSTAHADELLAKLQTVWPELALMIGSVVCLLFGLSKHLELRRLCSWVAFASVGLATVLVFSTNQNIASSHPLGLGFEQKNLKLVIAIAGLLLMLVNAYSPSQVKQCRDAEASDAFEPGDSIRGEFYFFMLMSLAGAMLVTAATDLPWLFLAIELSGLPTYVMVATMRDKTIAQESGIKYFFLGALSAAIFLYGFALIYGATGYTSFEGISTYIQSQQAAGEPMSMLLIMGLIFSIVGIGFKTAMFPMHFYAADVYQGAQTALTAFLAVIPKAAGFAALALVLGLVGTHQLPLAVQAVLAGIAIVTMCAGNFLGLVQKTNVKRVLAYSSVAHSGYLILGLLSAPNNGINAMVFYIAAYATATIAAMATLALIEIKTASSDSSEQNQTREAESFTDLNGLSTNHPALAAILALSMISLIGVPPLFGFFGKLALFGPALESGHTILVVIAVLNTAISAAYYLRIAAAPFRGQSQGTVTILPAVGRKFAVGIAAAATLCLGFLSGSLMPKKPAQMQIDPDPTVPQVMLETQTELDQTPHEQTLSQAAHKQPSIQIN